MDGINVPDPSLVIQRVCIHTGGAYLMEFMMKTYEAVILLLLVIEITAVFWMAVVK